MTEPEGLPEVPDGIRASKGRDPRVCPKCGNLARVVANSLGIQAYCGPCRTDWPISNPRPQVDEIAALPRGITKQTRVEPDWSLATENLDEEDEYEARKRNPIRPELRKDERGDE